MRTLRSLDPQDPAVPVAPEPPGAEVPDDLRSALEGDAVHRLLMDLQGANIMMEDTSEEGAGPRRGVTPGPAPEAPARFAELRAHLGVAPTGLPLPERDATPLPPKPPDTDEVELTTEEAPPGTSRRIPAPIAEPSADPAPSAPAAAPEPPAAASRPAEPPARTGPPLAAVALVGASIAALGACALLGGLLLLGWRSLG